ncbi:MAG TPA: HEAT repeat domain-containing protein [Pyrinomonadaceae bacterium]
MQENRIHRRALRIAASTTGVVLLITAAVVLSTSGGVRQGQTTSQRLTPVQSEIEKQRVRLSSAVAEDRREALTRLGSMRHPAASRVALSALSDPSPMVRSTAAMSVLFLPAEESVVSLLPLLGDKDEFVRQQVAYALGQTGSRAAINALIERLADKRDSVRGAAAVALGQIGDDVAVTPLAVILNPQSGLTQGKKNQKSKKERNPFVLRAAAHSLGEIGNRAAVPALLVVLQDEKAEDDVRREAAFALGEVGDTLAMPALRDALTARDPYLSQAAQEAIRRISRLQNGGKI